MKKFILLTIAIFCFLEINAQVPYFGATVGEGKVFGYTSLKFRPGINAQESYTTMQFGINDYFSVGADISANSSTINNGLYVRGGYTHNKWFSVGTQITPYFDLKDNFKYSNTSIGLFMNGNITQDGHLFWTSNSWATITKNGEDSFNQWWYLGGNVKINDENSIVPMLGLIHSWKFDTDMDVAAGFYYVYKKYSFYLWGNDFFKDNPRVTLAVDFTF